MDQLENMREAGGSARGAKVQRYEGAKVQRSEGAKGQRSKGGRGARGKCCEKLSSFERRR